MSSLDGMTQYCVRCEQDALGRKATIVGVQHTCGQQPREAPQAGGGAGALPGVNEALSDIEQVSADLEDCSSLDLNEWGDRVGEALEVIRTHLSQLTAERDALRAEVDRCKSWQECVKEIAALPENEELKRQARLDALRWVCSQAMCADWHDLGERIKAEIARLESNA